MRVCFAFTIWDSANNEERRALSSLSELCDTVICTVKAKLLSYVEFKLYLKLYYNVVSIAFD